MKNISLLILISLSTTVGAQTFSEWFRQKKTQKKYLLEQIAALQVHLGHVKKGYDIAKKGLDKIGQLKTGDLDLHTDRFASLGKVNPSIRNSPEVASIMDLQDRIMKAYTATIKQVSKGNAFTPQETTYIKGVLDRLLEDCDRILSEMLDVMTDGKLTMTDDERIKRIGQLQQEMQSDNLFIRSFSNGTLMLAASRIRDQHDVDRGRTYHGIQK